ncbi:MAG: GNAT family N-acetyltransferase [Planctomycetes bacterium]|nr:GNAT family N-acetyltransferase [Planctomycetota bacterium]
MDRRVAEYWAGVFGIEPDEFTAPGTRVVPNGGKVAGRKASWIFRHDRTCLISAPPQLVADVRTRAARLDPDVMQTTEGIATLFGGRADRTVGPAYQGHIAPDAFRPCDSPQVRMLMPADRAALVSLTALSEWNESGLAGDNPSLCGYFADGQLACVAGLIRWAPNVVNVGVITAPQHRRRGYARAAVSAAVQAAIARGDLVLYQTLAVNLAAVALAESLGCRKYAQHVFVSLRGWSSSH